MKVTAKTISEQLGISIATVDRALNNRKGVSPKTSKKILEKAEELNYIPNKSASFLSRKKQVLIAFVFPEFPEYFWNEIELGIKSAVADFQDYGFYIETIRTKKFDIEEQLETVQEIINSEKYDGLVLSPIDDFPFIDIINKGIERGIPIYTLNTDSPLSKRISYVGADYEDSGKLAGDLLDKFTPNSKKIALITDQINTLEVKKQEVTDAKDSLKQSSRLRSRHSLQIKQKVHGFKEYMRKCNDKKQIYSFEIESNNLIPSIMSLKDELSDMDGIYVASGVLVEVATCLEQMNFNNMPVLLGHDMSEEIHQFFIRGIVTASICQDPVHQGYLSVRKVFNHLMLDIPIEQSRDIVKLEIVTKGNVKYYIHK
ncbi:hypothetical protein CR203_18945 [Salipaludibacillus neizhouensis]|uniref:HTH lacI-type domain-containing protein n=1 Tax=Salipaludibacillus neizhouensis TaxID=885475 RepID=A0A3A9K5Z7_9BACI|nr:LacI family DNA-binding transcriptional regulator [Salipaludibacillus neizhouensis]RKL65731.1 hypothetical protein CR203_18945 [Salipaludibacillus neizhouensis]